MVKKVEVFTYHGQHGGVNNLAWLPNGKDIASVSMDHTIQVWNAFTGHLLFSAANASSLWAVAVSLNGQLIAWSGKDALVRVWSLVSQTPLYTYRGQAASGGIWGLAFEPGGQHLASGD